MYVVAIVAAGGQGRRFGGERPKQLLELAGRPILQRSVEAFVSHPRIDEIVVALPRDLAAAPPAYLRDAGSKPLKIVAGGERRQDSVARACEAASSHADLVVIHDAARPFVDSATIDRTIEAAAGWGAAIAAVQPHDTVKVARPLDAPEPPCIADTIDRSTVWLAQTPQAFTRAVLDAALAKAREGAVGTDEAALAEQAGFQVRLVEGSARNMKITTPQDLAAAEALIRAEQSMSAPARACRTGVGYDSHRFVQGRPLVLGGVTIPHAKGLSGHSDADALCHAITDAVLGAAALGDIGRHFPDTDPAWKDADSLELLRRAVALTMEHGWRVSSVDAVVIAEQPKLAPHVEAIRQRLASALAVEVDAVSVKGKTNEGMGETGRGEGVVVHAVATIVAAAV